MADDLGWSDVSTPLTNEGHPSDFFETPYLERLAKEGMAFSNAYTSGTNCAPTRTALLTGQYAQRPTNNVYQVGNLNRGGRDRMLLCPKQGLADGDDAIPASAFTYAEHLQQSGDYATAHVGKFHVTKNGKTASVAIRTEHGFMENYGGNFYGHPKHYHAIKQEFQRNIGPELDKYAGDYTQAYVEKNLKPHSVGVSDSALEQLVGTPKHASDALADAVIDFMDRKKGGPFMVQFHPFAVHTPIEAEHARKDLLAKYQQKPKGKEDSHASFAALTEGLDQSVARVVEYLKQTKDPNDPTKKLADNTIVIFYSDNGGRLDQSNNGPLRGQKGELHEGGIRVPLIVWSGNPNLVEGNTVNPTPVTTIDFYKTFGALANVEDPKEVVLDGEDLSGIFSDIDAKLDRDALFWHLPGYLKDGKGSKFSRDHRPESVIRSGKWKLRYHYETQSFELYNLETDISESTNVAAQKPEIVHQLGQMLLEHLHVTKAPLAKLRSDSLELNVTGKVYSEGKIVDHTGVLNLAAGDEVPYVLPKLMSH